MDLDQLPWFAIFKLNRFILSQQWDLVKIYLIAKQTLRYYLHTGLYIATKSFASATKFPMQSYLNIHLPFATEKFAI